MSKTTDIHALRQWEEYRVNLLNATPIDDKEDAKAKTKRIAHLEAHTEEWFAYYFPNYYTCPPGKFHINATNRLLNNDRVYEVRAWSRELAKSVRAMFEDLYMALTGMIKNELMVSASYDAAEKLLMPYMINLESNQRILNDYGPQIKPGFWNAGDFTARCGCSFRAIGAGQSPRGTRNENWRPDMIRIDDIDTDEETRNAKRIEQKWAWIEKALIPTVSVSGKYKIVFNGNIIAKNCTITKAIEKADFVDIINIRDKNGKSSWPSKNTEEDIDDILSKISYASAQQEYFNNPITEGAVFKEMVWGVIPEMRQFKYVIVYGDPANSDNAGVKSSTKAVFAIGELDHKYYIINGFLDKVQNSRFVEWYYDLNSTIRGTQLINYIENNSLQDPFYTQVFVPLFHSEGTRRGSQISIRPDKRKKADKYTRIEANLEPLNRSGKLIFNIAEKDNPNMQRLKDQFLAVEPALSAPADGPDCIEGGIDVIKRRVAGDTGMHMQPRTEVINNKKY